MIFIWQPRKVIIMNNLFKQRRVKHVQMLIKYWRLVFNDHFVIALFFIAGALAYSYDQLLAPVRPTDWWPRILIVLFMTLMAQLGRVATLLERPDEVFMLPQSDQMNAYFKQAFTYSVWPALLISLVATSIVLPLEMTISKVNTVAMILIIISALLVKLSNLAVGLQDISWSAMSPSSSRAWRWLSALFVWLLNCYLNPIYGCLLAIIVCAWLFYLLRQLRINWRLAVRVEDDRMMAVYRFFNLFTDVPRVQGQIRRRRWASRLINALGRENAWSFLYSRALVRGTEISGLLIRLTILGMIVIFFIPANWLNTIFSMLMLYLLMTQLLPLFDQFEDNAFVYIYPLPSGLQEQSFQKMVMKVMIAEVILLALPAVGIHLNWQRLVVNGIILSVQSWLMVRYYLPYRIKKL